MIFNGIDDFSDTNDFYYLKDFYYTMITLTNIAYKELMRKLFDGIYVI